MQVDHLTKTDHVDAQLARELALPTAWCLQNRGHYTKGQWGQIFLKENLRRHTDADLIEAAREMSRNSVGAQYWGLFDPS